MGAWLLDYMYKSLCLQQMRTFVFMNPLLILVLAAT